jgi:hypothetical protein
MMDQYADKDTDIEENIIVNDLDGEHADEDSSDIEAQVNLNIATERDTDFSRDVDAEDVLSREADIPVFRILFLRLPLPNPDGRFFCYLSARFDAKHRLPLASVLPVKILKISQLLNLREIENRRRQNNPLITTAPRKIKRFNVCYRRHQPRKTQNPSSAQPATATIETNSIEEFFLMRSMHAMALRNRKIY